MTANERRMAITKKLDELTRRMPANWTSWTAAGTAAFKKDVQVVTAKTARGSMFDFLQTAERVVTAYGLKMVQIDPAYGSEP